MLTKKQIEKKNVWLEYYKNYIQNTWLEREKNEVHNRGSLSAPLKRDDCVTVEIKGENTQQLVRRKSQKGLSPAEIYFVTPKTVQIDLGTVSIFIIDI